MCWFRHMSTEAKWIIGGNYSEIRPRYTSRAGESESLQKSSPGLRVCFIGSTQLCCQGRVVRRGPAPRGRTQRSATWSQSSLRRAACPPRGAGVSSTQVRRPAPGRRRSAEGFWRARGGTRAGTRRGGTSALCPRPARRCLRLQGQARRREVGGRGRADQRSGAAAPTSRWSSSTSGAALRRDALPRRLHAAGAQPAPRALGGARAGEARGPRSAPPRPWGALSGSARAPRGRAGRSEASPGPRAPCLARSPSRSSAQGGWPGRVAGAGRSGHPGVSRAPRLASPPRLGD